MFLQKISLKVQFIFFLLLFFIVTMFRLPILTSLYLLISCVSFAFLTDIFFTYLRKKTLFVPYSAVITGLILALIIDPSLSWFQIFIICFVAMGLKNFLRFSNRHIFNPAAAGLLAGWMIFGASPAWWGASLYTPGAVSFLNVIIYLSLTTLAFISCYRYKKWSTVLSFLLVFTILSPLFFSSFSIKSLISTVLGPGMLFYTTVMLVEPITSPVNKKRQMLYGVTVAVLYLFIVFIIRTTGQSLPDSSIIALLLGNLLFFKYR